MSSASMFGSPSSPVVMSWSFRSVYAGTMTTPRVGFNHVGARHLVFDAVFVGIRVLAKSFGRLNAVVVVEGVVRELPDRDDVSSLMERPHDQARWTGRSCGGKARRGKALDTGRAPVSERIATEDAE